MSIFKHPECDIYFVDEAHFFTDLVEATLKLFALGKTVFVYALGHTFIPSEFPQIGLIALMKATEHRKLAATCSKCRRGQIAEWSTVEDRQLLQELQSGDRTQIPDSGEKSIFVPMCFEHMLAEQRFPFSLI